MLASVFLQRKSKERMWIIGNCDSMTEEQAWETLVELMRKTDANEDQVHTLMPQGVLAHP